MNVLLLSEAEKKLCHLTLASEDPQSCQGSHCMAWSWHDADYVTARTLPGYRPKGLGWSKIGERDGMILWKGLVHDGERRGFCSALSPNPEVPFVRQISDFEDEPI